MAWPCADDIGSDVDICLFPFAERNLGPDHGVDPNQGPPCSLWHRAIVQSHVMRVAERHDELVAILQAESAWLCMRQVMRLAR